MYDYVTQHRWAKLKVGIVVTVSVMIIFFVIMFAGDLENYFAPKVKIYAMFTDIKGLREGSPVWFSGVEIGAVKSISFTTLRKIQVEMTVRSEALKLLKQDSKANILTLGLLGDKYVEILPGTGAERLKEGGIITGQTNIEIQDVVQTGQASIAKISDFVNTLEGILKRIEEGEGTASKFLKDPSVYNNLKAATGELTVILKKIEGGEGTMGKLLQDDGVYRDLSASVSDIKLFAASLKNSEGTLNKLLNDPSIYNRFQKASENLDAFTQRLASSKGTINKLLEDESLYKNIDSASAKLDRLLGRIDKGEGLAGSLIRDDEISKELKTTLKELNALIKDVKDNPRKYFKFSLF